MTKISTQIDAQDYERLTWLAAALIVKKSHLSPKEALTDVIITFDPPKDRPEYDLPGLKPGSHSLRISDSFLWLQNWGLNVSRTLRTLIAWEFDQLCTKVAAGEISEASLNLAHTFVVDYVCRKYADR
jgi:hypothetical protein